MTLIERLEALTGPCRECDTMIAIEAGWDIKRPQYPLPQLVDLLGMNFLIEAVTEYDSVYKTLPSYTASIDAAMTLVPDGWRLSQLEEKESGKSSAVIAKRFSLFQRKTFENGGQVVVQSAMAGAHTPAIALCIASLKARP